MWLAPPIRRRSGARAAQNIHRTAARSKAHIGWHLKAAGDLSHTIAVTPIGLHRGNNRLLAIHSDHLGTPRRMTDETGALLWQWPYSAFGANKPSGMLSATPNPRAAMTHQPMLLKATSPQAELNLRFPGQYQDEHAGQGYNLHRMYLAQQGRYTQSDPIGLQGGINTYLYAEANPLMYTDEDGLRAGGISTGSGLQIPTTMYRQMTLPGMPAGNPGYQPMPLPPRPVPTAGNGNAAMAFDLLKDSFGNLDKNTFSNLNWGDDIPGMPYMSSNCVQICVPSKLGQCTANSGCKIVCGPVVGPR